MREKLKNKSVGFFLRALSVLLAIVPLYYMSNIGHQMAEAPAEYVLGMIMLIIGIVIEVAALLLDSKKIGFYLALLGTVFLSFAFAYFVTGSCLSVIDRIYNIVMWGDAKQFPAIMAFGSILFVSVGLNVATCWMK